MHVCMWFTWWVAVMSNFQFNWIYNMNDFRGSQPMALQRLKHQERLYRLFSEGQTQCRLGGGRVSAIPPLFPIIVLSQTSPPYEIASVAVSCDASHGSERRLPRFYLEEVSKLFYSINLCSEPAAPVNGKINRCSFFVYNCSEWWITAHR